MLSFFFWHCFLHSIVFIHGDCLEFVEQPSKTNECAIQTSALESTDLYAHYPECLICRIESDFAPENVTLEKENRCLQIELRCIQLSFLNRETFEAFFADYQPLIEELFFKRNRTDQNTLHITFQEKSFDELNQSYIEEHFSNTSEGFRALILELRQEDQTLKLNRDLTEIAHLSMEIVLSCSKEVKRDEGSIYIVHDGQIFIEQESPSCAATLIPILNASSTTATADILPSPTTMVEIPPIPTAMLSASSPRSNKTLLIALLAAGLLSSSALISGFFYYKYCRKVRPISTEEETSETNSEASTHDDARSVDQVEAKVHLPVTIKKSIKPMNSRLIWLDDL